MKVSNKKQKFSMAVFLLALIVTVLFYFIFSEQLWILGLGAVLSLVLGLAWPRYQRYRRKQNYLQVFERRAKESFDLIQANVRRMLIDPVDVESVHQLRVSIRKFRAVISLAKPHMDYDSYLIIQDYFRQRGRDLADLREMDVLIDWTSQIEGLEDSEIIKRLKAMRLVEQEEVLKLLDEDYVPNLTKYYDDFLAEVRASVNSNFTEAFEDRVEGWDHYIMKRLPDIDDLEWSKVHRVRIKSKKARYVCDIFADDIDPDYASRKKEYKQIQSDLGVRCDQLRNLEAIDEWIKDDSSQIIAEKAIFKKATEAMGQEVAVG